MDVRKVMLLVGALVIAVVTAVMARNMFMEAGTPQAKAAAVAGPEVLVAARALPVGTIIDVDHSDISPGQKASSRTLIS